MKKGVFSRHVCVPEKHHDRHAKTRQQNAHSQPVLHPLIVLQLLSDRNNNDRSCMMFKFLHRIRRSITSHNVRKEDSDKHLLQSIEHCDSTKSLEHTIDFWKRRSNPPEELIYAASKRLVVLQSTKKAAVANQEASTSSE